MPALCAGELLLLFGEAVGPSCAFEGPAHAWLKLWSTPTGEWRGCSSYANALEVARLLVLLKRDPTVPDSRRLEDAEDETGDAGL